jgi:putative ABC transport system permease protein
MNSMPPEQGAGTAAPRLRQALGGGSLATLATLANTVALALGMASFLLILLFLQAELSYDRMHQNADRIYRVTVGFKLRGEPMRYGALSPLVLAETLKRDWPEVAEAGRIMPYLEGTAAGKVAVRLGREKRSYEYFSWADPSILRIFTLPFVAGDARTALAQPNTVILSQSVARQIFGAAPAVGRTLQIDSGYSDETYRVTGVFRDIPFNSHFHVHILASFSSLDHVKDPRIIRNEFWVTDTYTYVLLARGVPADRLRAKLPAFIAEHYRKVEGSEATLYLQSLGDIHLDSHQLFEFEANGDSGTVHVLAGAAVATLLLLCLNFMTLSTARYGGGGAPRDAAAVAPGGHRGPPWRRLFTESLILAGIALCVALALVELTLPALDALVGKPIALPLGPAAWGVALGLVLVASLAAATCGAAHLSAASPAAGGDGAAASGRRVWRHWRRVSAGLQVAIGVALLIAAGVVHDQLRFLHTIDLGFDIDHVIVVPIRDVALRDRYTVLKTAMERNPNVLGTTFSSVVLGQQTPLVGSWLQGVKSMKDLSTLVADFDFVKVLRLHLLAGRAFSPQVKSDPPAGFIINEATMRLWGLRSPQECLGKTLLWNSQKKGTVVGVVRDFHYQPLQVAVEPLVLHIRPLAFRYMYIRIAPQHTAATLQALGDTWRGLVSDKPFEAFWLADDYNRAYQGEETLGRLLGLAAVVVLVIAWLVLCGLASWIAEERRGEIAGGRAGGSGAAMAIRLGRQLSGLAVVASLLAWPLAWWLMQRWLAQFDPHTGMRPVHFLLAALAALGIAGLAVLVALWRASRVPPQSGAPHPA